MSDNFTPILVNKPWPAFPDSHRTLFGCLKINLGIMTELNKIPWASLASASSLLSLLTTLLQPFRPDARIPATCTASPKLPYILEVSDFLRDRELSTQVKTMISQGKSPKYSITGVRVTVVTVGSAVNEETVRCVVKAEQATGLGDRGGDRTQKTAPTTCHDVEDDHDPAHRSPFVQPHWPAVSRWSAILGWHKCVALAPCLFWCNCVLPRRSPIHNRNDDGRIPSPHLCVFMKDRLWLKGYFRSHGFRGRQHTIVGRQTWQHVAILALQYYHRSHRTRSDLRVIAIKTEQMQHRHVGQGNIYICASADNIADGIDNLWLVHLAFGY
ncbi:hypothetical protein F5888DRAFT_1889983 [Russula emetica]|nr:hypothetical protein F5888DRAFT_1889983 [Russula emetica]